MGKFTKDIIKDVAPKKVRGMINDSFVSELNRINDDPELMDTFKENFITYCKVLEGGVYKLEHYINAVKFVSLKLLGHTDAEAYKITFPEKSSKLISNKKIKFDKAVYNYKSTKIVSEIFKQTVVPSYVLNAPMHQDALNTLADIMINGRSEIARVNAANNILTHTKPPEEAKIKIDIGMDTSDAVAELRKATEELSLAQLQSIKAGKAVKEIAESTIVDAEIVED